jgi:hypothetical protein
VVISVADLGDFGPDPVPDPTSGKNGTGSDLWKKNWIRILLDITFGPTFFQQEIFAKIGL